MSKGRNKILTDKELQEAQRLKEEGITNRKIAELFEVGKTTIWDNVYRIGPAPKRKYKNARIYRFRKITIVLTAINKMRADGYNSKQIADFLNMPLDEVNVCINKGFKEFINKYPKYFE